jgi:lipoprotein-anchoring transpeptidase ErfK/SrfK
MRYIILFTVIFFSSTLFAKNFGMKLCQDTTNFACYTVKKGDTWESLFPNPTDRELIQKVNRLGNPLHTVKQIAIPQNYADRHHMEFSPFQPHIPASASKIIMVKLSQQAWGAYDTEGNLVRWGKASGGRDFCPTINRPCKTIKGKFSIIRKHGANCKSSKYPVGKGGAPMPYCMFFHGGFAIHGSNDLPGYHASHGCVRTLIGDAKWLNEEFIGNNKQVSVIIEP